MKNIEFVTVEEHISYTIRNVKLKVDIQLGDTLYKDAVMTIPESTLQSIVQKYETRHNW